MSKKGKGLGKFIIGASVGAALGMLFAPKKGSELRADLKNKMDELIDKAKNIDVDEVKDYVNKKVTEIRVELADLDIEYDTMKTMYDTMLEQLRAQKESEKTATSTAAQDTGLLQS